MTETFTGAGAICSRKVLKADGLWMLRATLIPFNRLNLYFSDSGAFSDSDTFYFARRPAFYLGLGVRRVDCTGDWLLMAHVALGHG